MPKIQRAPQKGEFTALHSTARSMGEGQRDCAVKAVAVACNVSYVEAHAALKKAGRKDGQGTPMQCTLRACKALGYKAEVKFDYRNMNEIIAQYPKAHRILKGITTHHPRRFRKVWQQFDDKVLMLLTPSHICTLKGGQLHDWAVDNALRVITIYEVTKI